MTSKNSSGIKLIMILLSIACMAQTAGALQTYEVTVDDDGGKDYTTIQAAINAVTPGYTVKVYPGTYNENLIIDRGITLTSTDGAGLTNITGICNSTNVINIQAGGVTINGFTISNSTLNAGIYLNCDNNILTNNILHDSYRGISVNGDNNHLANNSITDTYMGIYLLEACDNELINNTMLDNYQGIYLYSSSKSNNLTSNTISNSTQDGIKFHYQSNENTLTNNTVINNSYGFYLRHSSNNMLINNVASDNGIGIQIYQSCVNNTLIENTISNNEKGMFFYDTNNNSLINNTISNNTKFGLSISNSFNNSLSDNKLINNPESGFLLVNSNHNIIKNNTMLNNTFNFDVTGENYLENDIDTNNTADGKPIYYLVSQQDMSIDKTINAGIVYCIHCRNISIKDLNLSKTVKGIYFYNTTNSTISNNTARKNAYGIILQSCENCNLSNNMIINNIRYGIYTVLTKNSTFSDNTVPDNGNCGMYLQSSNNNNLTNNTISGTNEYGLYLSSSISNTLLNNSMSNNTYNFHISGYNMVNDIDTGNKIDGKPLCYLVNVADRSINSSTGAVYCINCRNISVEDMNITNNGEGIYFHNTTNSTLRNNTLSNNENGIYLTYSSGNHLIDNTAFNNNKDGIYICWSTNFNLNNNSAFNNSQDGIHLYKTTSSNLDNSSVFNNVRYGNHLDDSSDSSNLTNNRAFNNKDGIYLYRSEECNLTNNRIYNNAQHGVLVEMYSKSNLLADNLISGNGLYGVCLCRSSASNKLTGNNISDNPHGLCLDSSSSNLIYNNLFNNTNNTLIKSYNSRNVWNTTRTQGRNVIGGPYIGGNYWLTPNGTGFSQTNDTDNDYDDICDGAYTIESGYVDYLPLTARDPVAPQSITNLSVTTNTSSSINWTWTKPADPDLKHIMIYLNGNFQENVTTSYYLSSNMSALTTCNISTRTVDIAGNINSTWINDTSSTTATPSTPSHSSGTRSSVGQSMPPEDVASTDTGVKKVLAGADVEFDLSSGEGAVLGISFKAKSNEGNVVATVQVLNDRPSGVMGGPSAHRYQTMSITVGREGTISDHNADDLTIQFKVSKEWIKKNGIDPATIRMTRYHDGTWSDLPTDNVDQDSKFYYFTTHTPGFSVFEIVGDEAIEQTDQTAQVETQPATASEQQTVPEEQGSGLPGFTAAWGTIILGLAAVVCRYRK